MVKEKHTGVFYGYRGLVFLQRKYCGWKSNKGELVQSATDYQTVAKAVDAVGNERLFSNRQLVSMFLLFGLKSAQKSSTLDNFRENANDFRGLA